MDKKKPIKLIDRLFYWWDFRWNQ